jgi:hypothetical protein
MAEKDVPEILDPAPLAKRDPSVNSLDFFSGWGQWHLEARLGQRTLRQAARDFGASIWR